MLNLYMFAETNSGDGVPWIAAVLANTTDEAKLILAKNRPSSYFAGAEPIVYNGTANKATLTVPGTARGDLVGAPTHSPGIMFVVDPDDF